ncbi:MAG: TraR/DksA C4-type zinc finger protein [Chloroflexi bacterium]|nr:TraR/DksA C4-type zinc finger protein [Chloroflexota bacterium]
MAANLKQVRSRLEDEQKRLRQERAQLETGAQTTETRREGSPFGKREEEATESMELEKRLSLEKRITDSLAEIEHVLRKLEAGTYGLCDICGKPIPAERLEALPQASLCLDCKAKSVKGKVAPG